MRTNTFGHIHTFMFKHALQGDYLRKMVPQVATMSPLDRSDTTHTHTEIFSYHTMLVSLI